MKTEGLLALLCLLFFAASPAYGTDKINIDSDSMRITGRGEFVEFTGNVVVRAPEMTATAERARLDREGETVTAEGNVRLYYSSGTLEFTGFCTHLVFSRARGYIRMEDNVKAVYAPGVTATSTVVYSDKSFVDFSPGKQHVSFEDNVRARRGEVEVTSGLAEYDRDRELFTFTLSPRAVTDMPQAFTEYSGDKIIFSLTEEEVSMSGNALTRIKLRDDSGM